MPEFRLYVFKKILIYLILAVSFSVLISCENKFISNNQFIGSWRILTPDQDTIIFQNDSSFIRRYYDGANHWFAYSYDQDSITVQYQGPNMIYVRPSTHAYEIKNNELTIDFTNGCYGFDKRVYTLIRLQ